MTKYFLLFGLLLGSLGCSDGRDITDLPNEDPAEHVCEELGEPGNAIDAAADEDAAPELALDQPYTVTLPAEGSVYTGFVKLRGPADVLLFAGAEAVVTSFHEPGSSSNLLPQAAPNEFCAEGIPEHFDLELEEADDYIIALGPSAVESIWLMVVEAAEHGH